MALNIWTHIVTVPDRQYCDILAIRCLADIFCEGVSETLTPERAQVVLGWGRAKTGGENTNAYYRLQSDAFQ